MSNSKSPENSAGTTMALLSYTRWRSIADEIIKETMRPHLSFSFSDEFIISKSFFCCGLHTALKEDRVCFYHSKILESFIPACNMQNIHWNFLYNFLTFFQQYVSSTWKPLPIIGSPKYFFKLFFFFFFWWSVDQVLVQANTSKVYAQH